MNKGWELSLHGTGLVDTFLAGFDVTLGDRDGATFQVYEPH